MKINFEEMQVYDFSNLNLQEDGNDNCFSCEDGVNGTSNRCDYGNCDWGTCDCDRW